MSNKLDYSDKIIEPFAITTIATVTVSEKDRTQLTSNYDEFVPVFVENKEIFTVELILAYIGDKIAT